MPERAAAAPRRRFPRRLTYPALGVLLAQGAPLGLVLLRGLLAEREFGFAALSLELRSDFVTYGYVTLSTLVVLSLLGYHLGKLEDRLEAQAASDGLTGLANRRHFRERLAAELARAERHGHPLAVLAIDVDHLKPLNDQKGHSAGDAALRALAATIERTTRRSDLGARVGGDEFSIVAPDTHAAVARELAERVRTDFARTMVSLGYPEVTLSVGIADLTTSGFAIERLLSQADSALYASKLRGKDRVTVYERALEGASGNAQDADGSALGAVGVALASASRSSSTSR